MGQNNFNQPGQYRLLPNGLRGNLIVAAIRGSSVPLGHFGDVRAFKLLLQLTAKAMGKIADQRQKCEYILTGGGRFRFYMRDPYWTKILSPNYDYEPEIDNLLELAAQNDFCFLDCGANFGYWSILATSKWETCKEAIAVEPVPPTYELLLENRRINDDRFQTKNCALYDSDNEKVQIRFHPSRHAAASVSGFGSRADWSCYDVDTVTLDTLAKSFSDKTSPIVIKLDIEGLELKVIDSIRDLYGRPFVIIYEDHRKDLASATTRALLEKDNVRVYFMSDTGGVTWVKDIDQANTLQKDKRRGYNFALTEAGSSIDAMLQAHAH